MRIEDVSAGMLEVIDTCTFSIAQTQRVMIPQSTNNSRSLPNTQRQPPPPAKRTSSAPTPVRQPTPIRQPPLAHQAAALSTAVISRGRTDLPSDRTASEVPGANLPSPVVESGREAVTTRGAATSGSGRAEVSTTGSDGSVIRNDGRPRTMALVEIPSTRSRRTTEVSRAVKIVVPPPRISDDGESDRDESGDGESGEEESEDDISSDSDASASDESFAPEGQKKANTVAKAPMDDESSDSDASSSSASTAKSAPEARTPPSSPPSLAHSKISIPSLPGTVRNVCPICKKEGILSTHAGQTLLWCKDHQIQTPIRVDASTRNEAPRPPKPSSPHTGRAMEVSKQSKANPKPLKPPPSMGDFSLKRCQQRANGVTESESESDVPVPRKKRRIEPRKKSNRRKR